MIAKKTEEEKNTLVPQSIYNELVVLGPALKRKKFHHLLVSEPHVCSSVPKANRQCEDRHSTLMVCGT
jgi:hypothetical protein